MATMSGPGPGTAVLELGRLDGLVRRLSPLLQKAHLTVAEAAYVWRRARPKAGIGGATPEGEAVAPDARGVIRCLHVLI
jgi:hypothetical protein